MKHLDTGKSTPIAAAAAVDLPAPPRLLLGDLLRACAGLSEQQLQDILAYHREHHVPVGTAAVALGIASRADVVRALAEQFRYPILPADAAVSSGLAMATARDPFGPEAETFRELRTELLAKVFPDTTRRALAVVSPRSGDGKSYVAANLAVSFSQLGRPTLLIDADMRSPVQHRLFGLELAPGLSTILSGRLDDKMIRRMRELPALHVLTSGAIPPNPVELLEQEAFSHLLRQVLQQYDYVIVDTPAGQRGPDARVIAPVAGAALVVARTRETRMAELQGMTRWLRAGPVKLAGVVVNTY